jgi:hypothetical protein
MLIRLPGVDVRPPAQSFDPRAPGQDFQASIYSEINLVLDQG